MKELARNIHCAGEDFRAPREFESLRGSSWSHQRSRQLRLPADVITAKHRHFFNEPPKKQIVQGGTRSRSPPVRLRSFEFPFRRGSSGFRRRVGRCRRDCGSRPGRNRMGSRGQGYRRLLLVVARRSASAEGWGLGSPGQNGMLSEYVVLSADRIAAAPKTLSLAQAATLPCAALTVDRTERRPSRYRPDRGRLQGSACRHWQRSRGRGRRCARLQQKASVFSHHWIENWTRG